MNRNNYASLEASKCLVDVGIVLETDMYWYEYEAATLASLRDGKKLLPESYIVTKESVCKNSHHWIPAPCMAEVWRELPEIITKNDIDFCKCLYGNSVGYYNSDLLDEAWLHSFIIKDSTNPTDALVDLLIWVRKEKRND